MERTVKICMAGFGNVGVRFARMLLEHERSLRDEYNCRVVVTGVCTRTRGTVINPEGLDLGALLIMKEELGRFDSEYPGFTPNCGAPEMIERCGADIFIELSTLSVKDGEPASSYIRAALEHGMHVITANKGPEAWRYAELKALADEHGKRYLFETAVLDGTPLFNMARGCLPGCDVTAIRGIINTTTNFILGEIERGGTYDEAVAEAQRRQFAEADPSMDVDGWDGAAKICALANVLMNANATPEDVRVRSLREITPREIKAARETNCRIKYICSAERAEDGALALSVAPALVPMDDPAALVNGTSNIITLRTDMMGEISIIEKDPEIKQTAYGVYSDLLTIIGGEKE